MVSIYFGLPGSGKTTLAVKHIMIARKRGLNVYTNIDVKIDGVYKIERNDFGKYNICNGLVIIDEGSLLFDNRDFKQFNYNLKYFFLMHRHYHVDIEIYTQKYDGLDSKIRNIADSVYWVRKGSLFRNKSSACKVPYGVYIPEKDDTAHVGEIINGYYKPSLWSRLFSEKCKRKKYYKYFDSFDRVELESLPTERVINIPNDWHIFEVKFKLKNNLLIDPIEGRSPSGSAAAARSADAAAKIV